jgi:hypothetical protein
MCLYIWIFIYTYIHKVYINLYICLNSIMYTRIKIPHTHSIKMYYFELSLGCDSLCSHDGNENLEVKINVKEQNKYNFQMTARQTDWSWSSVQDSPGLWPEYGSEDRGHLVPVTPLMPSLQYNYIRVEMFPLQPFQSYCSLSRQGCDTLIFHFQFSIQSLAYRYPMYYFLLTEQMSLASCHQSKWNMILLNYTHTDYA